LITRSTNSTNSARKAKPGVGEAFKAPRGAPCKPFQQPST
jgi:hypothetical protein